MSRHLVVAIAAAALLAGCTGSPEPSPTPSNSAVATPSASSTPSASATPTASPSPTPEPSETSGLPAGWKEISPSAAGVDESSVTAVIGAWQLPTGGVASVVTVPNQADTVIPEAFYQDMFAEFGASGDFDVSHGALTTAAGEPALVVTVVPTSDGGGDAQQFIVVLRSGSVTWATVSDSPGEVNDSGDQLWSLVRTLPAS